tara:strand:+ start:307 stop:450 length:144 start_codon:yes stop_codon:yes gene_type:complete
MIRILEKLYEILVESYEIMIKVHEINYENKQYINEYNQRIPIMRGKL